MKATRLLPLPLFGGKMKLTSLFTTASFFTLKIPQTHFLKNMIF